MQIEAVIVNGGPCDMPYMCCVYQLLKTVSISSDTQ